MRDRMGPSAPGLWPSLWIVSLLNGDAIRREFGIAARDQALGQLCEAFKSVAAPGDYVGSLTGNELAMLMLATDEAARAGRRQALFAAVAARPFLAGARRMDLEVACGVAPLAPGCDVEQTIAAADANLMAAIGD